MFQGSKNKKVPNLSIEDLCLLSFVGMTRLATTQTKSASLNAHLASSLNGLHKAFVSRGTLEIKLFSVPHTSINASIRRRGKQKSPQSFD